MTSNTARRRPLWLANLLTGLGLAAGVFALAALAGLFKGLGWPVAMWITLGLLIVYSVILFMAVLGYCIYLIGAAATDE